MIEKINLLKNQTNSNQVKSICENAITNLSSIIYNNVTSDAKFEIERVTVENLFEQLSNIDDKKTKKWVSDQKRLYTLRNLGVREAINSLYNQENNDLKIILEEYKDYLDRGISEPVLYEQFTSALQSFSYFPQVGNAVDAIKNRVDAYKTDVDISKIIETMKTTRSNYLVPLIEDAVDNYLANKTEQTKSHLKEKLVKFTYDSFVRDIVSLVSLDATDLQLEYASANSDIDKIYSPVMYIGENEAIFNVKGFYYIKKGNNVNRLKEDDKSKLDKEFVFLCETLNDPNIVLNRQNISYYYGKEDKAIVSNKSVILNEQTLSHEQFSNAFKDSQWAGNAKSPFYQKVELLRENFNNIAEIDFVKRVYLKENADYAADVFKLRDNIFITTHDPKMGKSTFYRNVNPIQAKQIMMEHLRFDVSKTFENLLPDEEKILSEIKETKGDYDNYINDLQKRIVEFRDNPYGKDISEQVIGALVEELKEIKEEYKDYLNRVESYIEPSGDDIDEGISVTIDVHGKKYNIPIPDTAQDGETEDDPEAGTEVGAEDVEDKPADAVTFDDEETELLGDSPSMQDSEVDLGGDEAEADADSDEAEAERDKEEQEKESKDNEEDDDADRDEEDDEDDKEKDEEEDDVEESTEGNLKKEKFAGDKPKKRKVFLKKRKVDENLNEHHKTTKAGKIKFICSHDKKCKKEDLEKMSAEEVDKKYKAVEKKTGININEHHKTTKKGKIDFILKNDKKADKEKLEKMSVEEVDKKYASVEKKLGMRESSGQKKTISKGRLNTLSGVLDDMSSFKSIKDKAKDEEERIEYRNKLQGKKRQLNKFIDEFGKDFLKKELEELHSDKAYSKLLTQFAKHESTF